MSISVDGVELSKYRTNMGDEYFLEVLQEGQKDGHKMASKDGDNPRRREKSSHFEIYSMETHEATYLTAPFLGVAAEGKELPADEFLDAYEDFFRAYRSCFVDWLRNHGAGKKDESASLFGDLIVKHAVRKPGTKLDPIIESIYPIPLSSKDPEVDTLEKRFLAWLLKA